METIQILIYCSIYLGLIATTFFILSFISDKKRKTKFYTDEELPFVSVLIPAYDEEKTIAKTIKSISAVEYPRDRLEIIVIDDGSKDKTLGIAKKFKSKLIQVFHKKNGGKGDALNFGLKKSRGQIIVSMDADTFVHKKSLIRMVRYFKEEKVMCVSPAMVIHEPKSILQKIQHVEYLLGLFLRKAFASVNAVHVTPGAFSAYRKSFFDKYGEYAVGNITEDLELALRIQYHHFIIQNAPDAPIYTTAPTGFYELLVQRRRWYVGLLKNTWKYKKIIFNPQYGDLGMFVIPVAWASIFFSVVVTCYLFVKTLLNIWDEITFLQAVNFSFSGFFELNKYVIERFLFLFFTNPIIIFLAFFLVILGFYLYYASKKIGKMDGVALSLPLFFAFFAVLFGIWWVISLIYVVFNKKIIWRR